MSRSADREKMAEGGFGDVCDGGETRDGCEASDDDVCAKRFGRRERGMDAIAGKLGEMGLEVVGSCV